ncbi:MAG: MFS transporter [Rudanella sp.]|nr:MFS transporter [Rudanella sp.]
MQQAGSYRWRIVALLFIATTINYIDRQVLSFTMIDDDFRRQMLGLAPGAILTQEMQDAFKIEYGKVDAAFKTAYALGFLIVGWLIDRIGTKRGFSIGIIIWSIAGIMTSFVNSFAGLRVMRALLGFGESANFPASIKSIAEWFPRKERALANGLFNAGTNVGVILTALSIPYLTLHYGWRPAFAITGALGILLLIGWWFIYDRPDTSTKVSAAELVHIRQDGDVESSVKVPWLKLLTYRQTWAFVVGKFMTDPIWWFYLSWLPDFFNSNEALDQKLDLKNIGIPFLVIYIVSDVGSVFFGWLSSQFLKWGWSLNRARKTTLAICAVCVMPIFLASTTNNIYLAVALLALATSAHQGWSANMYTFASDMFPKKVVASVTGIGGMAGAVAGILFAYYAGIIRVTFGYLPLFLIAATTYSVAFLLIHLLVPKLQSVKIDEEPAEVPV